MNDAKIAAGQRDSIKIYAITPEGKFIEAGTYTPEESRKHGGATAIVRRFLERKYQTCPEFQVVVLDGKGNEIPHSTIPSSTYISSIHSVRQADHVQQSNQSAIVEVADVVKNARDQAIAEERDREAREEVRRQKLLDSLKELGSAGQPSPVRDMLQMQWAREIMTEFRGQPDSKWDTMLAKIEEIAGRGREQVAAGGRAPTITEQYTEMMMAKRMLKEMDRQSREQEDTRHEDPGHTVGQPGDWWLLRTGAVHQAEDPGQHRARTGALDRDRERALPVLRAPDDLVARALAAGPVLARQHRLVHPAAALDHPPIGRHGLAGPHQHPVPRLELVHRDDLVTIADDAGRVLGAPPQGTLDGRGGALACAHLEETPDREQEDEHADGVEVDLPAAENGRRQARPVGDADREGDGDVHAEAAIAEITPGGGEERPRRVEDDRGRDDTAHDPEQVAIRSLHPLQGPGVERDRVHHHLHGADPRHGEATQRRSVLEAPCLLLPVGTVGLGAVAEAGELGEEGAEAGLALAPAELGALAGEVDGDVEDARLPAEVPLDQPDAGRTAEPPHRQGRPPPLALLPADEDPLQRGLIVAEKLLERGREAALRIGRGSARWR